MNYFYSLFTFLFSFYIISYKNDFISCSDLDYYYLIYNSEYFSFSCYYVYRTERLRSIDLFSLPPFLRRQIKDQYLL